MINPAGRGIPGIRDVCNDEPETNTDEFGIDEEGSSPLYDESYGVTVPETLVDLSEEQLRQLSVFVKDNAHQCATTVFVQAIDLIANPH